MAQGQTKEAETIFAEIQKRREAEGASAFKEAAAAARHRGALAFLHDTNKALAAYRKATALDPDDSEGWNQLGHLLHRIGNLDDAAGAYEHALALGTAADDRVSGPGFEPAKPLKPVVSAARGVDFGKAGIGPPQPDIQV